MPADDGRKVDGETEDVRLLLTVKHDAAVAALRTELLPRLVFTGRAAPARLPGIVAGLPGMEDHEYWSTRRELVIEIATDGVAEYGRWRHPVRALRLRSDLTAIDCAAHA